MESKELKKQRNISTKYKPFAKKSTSGITLIALVVTIIVLLILAGISINLILGENGIIKKASLAKEAQEMAQLKEEAELVKATGLAENLSKVDGEYGKADLLEDLNNNFEGSTLGSDRITTSDGKYDIIVDDDLNITVEKSGETENAEIRKIIITSSIEEREGIEYIDLIFEVEGMPSCEEYYLNYIEEYLYPDKSTEELENKLIEFLNVENEADGLEPITTMTDEYREAIMNDGKNIFMTETYEQSLKMHILLISTVENTEFNYTMQEAAELVTMKTIINAGYNYICDIYNEEKYEEATDIENQMLRIAKYDGDFESLLGNLGTTRDKLETEANNMGLSYVEYIKYLGVIMLTEVNVNVSNGDSFTSSIVSMNDANLYSYEITQDGEYTFTAESDIGGLKGQTTVRVGTVPVTNPFEKDGWEVAWTCTDGTTWSEQITNDGTTVLPTEGVIAKLYNTGNTITPQAPESLGGNTLDAGAEYKLVFEGSGSMGSLDVNEGFKAWVNTQYSFYISEVIISEGITNIPDSAFWFCVSLKTIEMPETIENIGKGAFQLCHKLTGSIKIPEEMTSIGEYTFNECANVREVIMHEGITSIGESAFDGCKSITNISIPNNVTSIGRDAFQDTGITEITIPEGVTEILYATFADCANLTSVTIPSSVTTIDEYAFKNCTKLTSIEIPDTVQSIGTGIFKGCSELANVKLSSNISSISMGAFQDCTKLKTITIPNSVTSIGSETFSGCTSLEKILIPDTVTSIGSGVFENCTSLASVTLSNNISSIEGSVFKNCSALTSITIPSGVTAIWTSTFENCSSLKSVTILTSDYIYIEDNAFMGLPAESYIYVPNSTIKAKFTDGTHYDSTKTTISIK